MQVLQVFKQIKDSTFTYSLMGADSASNPSHVHINNHKDNSNAVLVSLDKVKELIAN